MRTSPNPVKSFLSACMLALLLLAASDASDAFGAEAEAKAPAAPADVAASILQLTGAETRIVWIRNKQWEGGQMGLVDGGAFEDSFQLDKPETRESI